MAADYEARVRAIDWARYATAYGSAAERGPPSVQHDPGTTADELVRLASSDRDEALRASHNLWCALCHQHVHVGTAALPATPFVLEVLDIADDELTVELLDILVGFAIGARSAGAPGWLVELRGILRDQLPRWQRLRYSTHEDAAAFATVLVESLES
jgi:hypothetical protein